MSEDRKRPERETAIEAAYDAHQNASLEFNEVAAEYWDAPAVPSELSRRYDKAYMECVRAYESYVSALTRVDPGSVKTAYVSVDQEQVVMPAVWQR